MCVRVLNISINDIWNRNLMALIRVHLYVKYIYLKHTLCTVERVWMDSRFGWHLLNPNGRAIIGRKSSKSYAIIYSFGIGNSDTLRFYVLFSNLFNHVANYNPSWLAYGVCMLLGMPCLWFENGFIFAKRKRDVWVNEMWFISQAQWPQLMCELCIASTSLNGILLLYVSTYTKYLLCWLQ